MNGESERLGKSLCGRDRCGLDVQKNLQRTVLCSIRLGSAPDMCNRTVYQTRAARTIYVVPDHK